VAAEVLLRELPRALSGDREDPIFEAHGRGVELQELSESWVQWDDPAAVLPALLPEDVHRVVLEVEVLLFKADGFGDSDAAHPEELEEHLVLVVVDRLDVLVHVAPVPVLRQGALYRSRR